MHRRLIFNVNFSTIFMFIFIGIFKHTQSLAKTYLAQSTSENEHSVVFGQFNSVTSIGFILGPIVGGHVAERDDGFYIVSAITAVSFIVLYGIFLYKLKKYSA